MSLFSNYILLARIIEETTGESYGEHLRRRFFEPLELRDTLVDSSMRVIPKRAAGYGGGGDVLVNAPWIQPDSALG